MTNSQLGVLAEVPPLSRYLTFQLRPGRDPKPALEAIGGAQPGDTLVVGLGASLVAAVGGEITGLREFPPLVGPGIVVPSTPAALWCWLRGSDRGDLVHASRAVVQRVAESFQLDSQVDGFKFGDGRDLSGYVDGTENPEGDAAVAAAIVGDDRAGVSGSSFVAVQRWRHNLNEFQSFSAADQDDIIGRRKSDNQEFEEAPESAHVKRTAQEGFEPEAFVVRRSMPWADSTGEGLMFVAFGKSFDAFEAQMRRMVGHDDPITDGLFRFTAPQTGSYFWCPPTEEGRLDLSALPLS